MCYTDVTFYAEGNPKSLELEAERIYETNRSDYFVLSAEFFDGMILFRTQAQYPCIAAYATIWLYT